MNQLYDFYYRISIIVQKKYICDMKVYPDKHLLEAEGVTFKSNGHVDMERHLWRTEI